MTATATLRPEEIEELARLEKRKKWRLFSIGLVVRLLGVVFLWLGNGHDSYFRKGLVVVGIVLSIGGIGVLRFLLISGFRKKKAPNQAPEPTAPSGRGSP